jgi:integrase
MTSCDLDLRQISFNNVATDAMAARVVGAVDLPGTARLFLVEGVIHLDPQRAVFEAMMEGWVRQQRSRFLKESTIEPRLGLVRRLSEFTNAYPWDWQPADGEAFIEHLRSANRDRPIAMSTGRAYETALALFMEFVIDRRYGWAEVCLERFGQVPQQIFHEDNRVVHSSEFEGQPGRRPFTYDEVQALFDAVDARGGRVRAQGRKGVLTALRDAALLKTVYAFGLRRREVRMLDLADLRRNPKLPEFKQYGGMFVRYAKSSRGGPPRRRTVLTVPEMDWIVEVLDHWIGEVRPRLAPSGHPALFVSERGDRISDRGVNQAFTQARDDTGLPDDLDLHSLRHSYVTHLIEFDYPEKFVSLQVGHAYASSTAVYSHVSDDYRNQLVRRSLHARHGAVLWEESP